MGSSNEDKPLRYACDRCHSQKLRCPRSAESEKANPEEPCSRCRKAGVPCVVSLRGKVGRPAKASKKKSTQPSSRRDSPESDFPSYDVDSMMSGDGDDSAAWKLPPGDPLLEMFELGSTCGSATTAASPRTMPEDRSTSQPTGSRAFPGISTGPGFIQMPYEPFVMDFDTDVDYPTFCIPPSFTDVPTAFGDPAQLDSMLDMKSDLLTPPPQANVSMPSSSKSGFTFDATTLDPRMSFSSNENSPGDIFANEDFEPVPEFSSTASYQRLSDLNVRILKCSGGAQSGRHANSAQLLKDVTGFSGELIDTARQSMPHFLGSTRTPSLVSSASTRVSSSRGSEDGDTPMDRSVSQSSWASTSSTSKGSGANNSVPESAVIFLLLGCYTQILHLFEVTTNCLWTQHCENGQAVPAVEDPSGTVGSLLEASIAIHTVTYLLSRLHQALAVPEGDSLNGASETQAWKKSFVGGKELEDGLLGRAFGEIREREMWLMRRTQHLQQQINRCHI